MVVPPAVAVAVPPVHVVAAFGVAAIVTFVGKVSITPMFVSGTAVVALLRIVMVKSDVAPGAMTVCKNDFEMPTPDVLPMFNVACAGAALLAPCSEVNAPAEIVFTKIPGTAPVTVTVIAQVAPARTVPFASETTPAPATAVTVPPAHDVDEAGTGATKIFGGNASLRAIPESGAAPAALLTMLIVMTDVEPGVIVVRLKALLMLTAGAAVYVSPADDPFWFCSAPALKLTPAAPIVFVTRPGAAVVAARIKT
jgi:hypothetical protein